jgi:hypothetical protein
MRLQDVLVLINEMEIPYAEKFSSPSIQKVSAILSQEFRCLSTHFKHQAKGVDTVLSLPGSGQAYFQLFSRLPVQLALCSWLE